MTNETRPERTLIAWFGAAAIGIGLQVTLSHFDRQRWFHGAGLGDRPDFLLMYGAAYGWFVIVVGTIFVVSIMSIRKTTIWRPLADALVCSLAWGGLSWLWAWFRSYGPPGFGGPPFADSVRWIVYPALLCGALVGCLYWLFAGRPGPKDEAAGGSK